MYYTFNVITVSKVSFSGTVFTSTASLFLNNPSINAPKLLSASDSLNWNKSIESMKSINQLVFFFLVAHDTFITYHVILLSNVLVISRLQKMGKTTLQSSREQPHVLHTLRCQNFRSFDHEIFVRLPFFQIF